MLQPECVDCKWYDGFGQCLEHGNHLKDNCEDFEVCFEKETRYCRTCKHRKRIPLNEYSNKVVQCCDLQRSRRSNSGYKTIKVTNMACGFYEPKVKGGEDE